MVIRYLPSGSEPLTTAAPANVMVATVSPPTFCELMLSVTPGIGSPSKLVNWNAPVPKFTSALNVNETCVTNDRWVLPALTSDVVTAGGFGAFGVASVSSDGNPSPAEFTAVSC